jgi:hypothetical protein
MRVKQQDGQHSKKALGDQAGAKALKSPRTTGLNTLLETVRRKMAYTIRGI